ncbi:MAG: esterase/lipase family protein, partial [Pyrinomonadaceae bacterium]
SQRRRKYYGQPGNADRQDKGGAGRRTSRFAGTKVPESLVVIFENLPVRCGKVKFKITTQPFEKGAIIFSDNGETTDEVILDLTQVGKDASAEIGFQLGKQDGLYKVTASLIPAGGESCNSEQYVFQLHAGKMVVQLLDLNNPDYYTAVADTSNPEFDTWRATMTADIEKLSRGGDGRTGALADGASMLLIRAQLIGFTDPPEGDVKFNISGDGNIGHLSRGLGEQIPEYNGGPAFTTQWVKTNGGVFAFALYTPPKNFGYSTASIKDRKVALDVTYKLKDAPAPFEQKQDLTLEKPPVALIHGLWSGPSTWGKEFTSNSRGYETHLVDYSHLNSRSFSQLSGELHAVILEMKRKLRLRKIAATRVNVVGHSMGGLVTRQLVADDHGRKHFRKDNFGKGEIYKFMTIGTPHFGSPLAWLGVNFRNELPLLVNSAGASDMINGGAVDAMCPGSKDLQALGPTNVPTNTVRAWNVDSRSQIPTELDVVMTDILKNSGKLGKPTPAGLSFAMLRYATTAIGSVGLSRLYSADKTDVLVTVFSQSGGIAQGGNNVFDKTLHFDLGIDLAPDLYYETTSAAVAGHVFDTLNRDYDDINFFARRLPAPQVQDDFINCTARK